MNRLLFYLTTAFLLASQPVWAADITECQTISTAGTYVLQNDVVSNGTCFAIATNGVTLDLNGHTVTYDNATPISVPNYSFEDAVTGTWDFTSAPNATRAAGSEMGLTSFTGEWSLQIPTPVSDQHIVSISEVQLQPNTRYSISAMVYNLVDDNCTISVSLNETAIIAAQTMKTWRGFQYIFYKFTTGASVENHKIRISFAGLSDASAGTVYVDDIRIQHSEHYGVHVGSDNARYNNVVKNGSIRQGQARGDFSHAVRGDVSQIQPFPVAIYDHLNLYVWGNSCHAVWTNYITNSQLTNCVIESDVETIWRRDYYEGYPVKLGAESSGGLVANNTILNSVQGGISLNSLSEDPVIVANNTIHIESKYTNAFGIIGNGIIANNTITGYGRGIFSSNSRGADIYGNNITVEQLANNQEYGGCAGAAYGIQTEDVAQNTYVHNNTVNVTADECDAVGYMFWGPETKTEMGNKFYDNVVTALVAKNSIARAAVLRTFQRYETEAREIYDNTFRTNGNFFWFHYLTAEYPDRSMTGTNNTFETVYPVAPNYKGIVTSTNSAANSPKNVVFTGNVYADEYTRAALEDVAPYSLLINNADIYATGFIFTGDALPEEPTPDPDPEEPTDPTTSGPILRTGSHLLRVGDSVLRVQ